MNVHVVTKAESKSVFRAYKKHGWLREMYAQMESVGADVDEFKSIDPERFCCVKFRPHDLRILEEPSQFTRGDPAVPSDYYNLKQKIGVPSGIETHKFTFNPGGTSKKGKSTATYRSHTKEIDLVHNQIQEQIFTLLALEHGKDNVACEQSTGYGTNVDLVVQYESGYTFYELKTSNTAKQCIREALSQLLEYSHYPNAERASKLIVVAPVSLSSDSKRYLAKLRSLFAVPIFYQKFDLETRTLGSEE